MTTTHIPYRTRLLSAFYAVTDAGSRQFLDAIRAEHLRGEERVIRLATEFFQTNPDLLPADFGHLLAYPEIAELAHDTYESLFARSA